MANPLLQSKPRLGDRLIAQGYLTPDQLQSALELQHGSSGNPLLGEVLIEHGLCTEEHVLECVAADLGIPFVRLDNRVFDPKIVDSLPRDVIDQHTVLPLFRIRDVLSIAVSDPMNIFLVDRLRELCGSQVELVVATAKDIRRMVQTYLPDTRVFVIDDIIDDVSGNAVELIEQSIDDIGFDVDLAGQSPIIRLVNYIVYTAVKEGASDIHIEPSDRQLRVRYRVDGALFQGLDLPMHIAPAIASRIKIMANLDISERRLPQDGGMHVLMEGRPIDLRISSLPLAHGEKVVMRILDQQSVSLSLSQLGFSSENLQLFHNEVERPNGIALVTGPTGSGKSTTLYAALNLISSIERNVCTVEDPVEYSLPLINQFQTNEKIGLSFAKILRSLLRQDPDVIMVGEIRDQETARIAIQAALTGHLVLSTLHTNDACSAITRLIDMGIERYLLGAGLNMVLGQRLCRKVCNRCRRPYDPGKALRMGVEAMGLSIPEYTRGLGCKNCRNTGFSGRIPIHELLAIDDGMRERITSGAPLAEIREHARRVGMIPLRYDGLRKVREGMTTVEEVFHASTEGWNPLDGLSGSIDIELEKSGATSARMSSSNKIHRKSSVREE